MKKTSRFSNLGCTLESFSELFKKNTSTSTGAHHLPTLEEIMMIMNPIDYDFTYQH